ncbi:hypothetical protein COS64_04740 [archaeon CG06_land_8_20_14_3_00_37_11]|nr:MAG: hypothetical protein COS64_04740 [archaeon CG06_land_8_20_14_3_00_37_11]
MGERLHLKRLIVLCSWILFLGFVFASIEIASIDSPTNTTYNSSDVWFNVTTNETADWCGYSIDGFENISMSNDSTTTYYFENSSVPEGSHNVTFSCNDSAGGMNFSETLYFTIDLTAPEITIESPLNITYKAYEYIDFNITSSEEINWCGVSVFGTDNITMTNDSLTHWFIEVAFLTIGSPPVNVSFSCNDTVGNMNTSEPLYFTIDGGIPGVEIESPSNTEYSTSDVWFNITANETADWCGFSLDNEANVTMANDSLTHFYYLQTNLDGAVHEVTFYCNDSVGYYSNGNSTSFTVSIPSPVHNSPVIFTNIPITVSGTPGIYTLTFCQILNFNFNNNQVILSLQNIYNDSIRININSDFYNILLGEAVTKDLNNDGVPDIKITLKSINAPNATISINLITGSETETPDDNVSNETTQNNNTNNEVPENNGTTTSGGELINQTSNQTSNEPPAQQNETFIGNIINSIIDYVKLLLGIE